MAIELTEQQQRALDSPGDPPRVIDPRTSAAYVLIPAGDYEAVREVLEDEQRRQVIGVIARRNAIGRMDEMP